MVYKQNAVGYGGYRKIEEAHRKERLAKARFLQTSRSERMAAGSAEDYIKKNRHQLLRRLFCPQSTEWPFGAGSGRALRKG